MATTSDTNRAAIRERKRQAQVALRERHQRQEAAQTAAFAALDRLARHLDQADEELAANTADPLERAAAVTAIAAQLTAVVDEVRVSAGALAAEGSMTQAEVAELLGTRTNLLFPRPKSTGPRPPIAAPADGSYPTEGAA